MSEYKIVFVRNKLSLKPITWLSFLIRVILGFKYNHVAIVRTSDKYPKEEVWESTSYGFTSKWLWRDYKNRKDIVFEVISSKATKSSEKRFKKARNSRYDFVNLVVHQLVLLLAGMWVGAKRYNANKRMICSESVAYIIGIEDYFKYNPKTLYERLEKNIFQQTKSPPHSHYTVG